MGTGKTIEEAGVRGKEKILPGINDLKKKKKKGLTQVQIISMKNTCQYHKVRPVLAVSNCHMLKV